MLAVLATARKARSYGDLSGGSRKRTRCSQRGPFATQASRQPLHRHRCRAVLKDAGASVAIKVITFPELIGEYAGHIRQQAGTTLEATEVGRLLQLMAATNLLPYEGV